MTGNGFFHLKDISKGQFSNSLHHKSRQRCFSWTGFSSLDIPLYVMKEAIAKNSLHHQSQEHNGKSEMNRVQRTYDSLLFLGRVIYLLRFMDM